MEQNETRTLWLSVAAAAFAVMLLYGWAQGKRTSYARKFGQTKTVVVAKKDILEMDIINESQLELVEKPADFVEPEALDSPTNAIGLMPLAPIRKGEQILNTKLVSPGTSTGLSMQVSPRKRAITIPVDDIRGVNRMIRPGDRIDLVTAVDVGKGVQKEKKVRTVMWDVPVLAVGQHIVDNIPVSFKGDEDEGLEIQNLRVENRYNSLTVEVKPSQAQVLIHIMASGNPLYTTLRNPNDRFPVTLPEVGLSTVLNRKLRKPSQAPRRNKLPKRKPDTGKKPKN